MAASTEVFKDPESLDDKPSTEESIKLKHDTNSTSPKATKKDTTPVSSSRKSRVTPSSPSPAKDYEFLYKEVKRRLFDQTHKNKILDDKLLEKDALLVEKETIIRGHP